MLTQDFMKLWLMIIILNWWCKILAFLAQSGQNLGQDLFTKNSVGYKHSSWKEIYILPVTQEGGLNHVKLLAREDDVIIDNLKQLL